MVTGAAQLSCSGCSECNQILPGGLPVPLRERERERESERERIVRVKASGCTWVCLHMCVHIYPCESANVGTEEAKLLVLSKLMANYLIRFSQIEKEREREAFFSLKP